MEEERYFGVLELVQRIYYNESGTKYKVHSTREIVTRVFEDLKNHPH